MNAENPILIIEKRLKEIVEQKNSVITTMNYNEANELRIEEIKLKEELLKLKKNENNL